MVFFWKNAPWRPLASKNCSVTCIFRISSRLPCVAFTDYNALFHLFMAYLHTLTYYVNLAIYSKMKKVCFVFDFFLSPSPTHFRTLLLSPSMYISFFSFFSFFLSFFLSLSLYLSLSLQFLSVCFCAWSNWIRIRTMKFSRNIYIIEALISFIEITIFPFLKLSYEKYMILLKSILVIVHFFILLFLFPFYI